MKTVQKYFNIFRAALIERMTVQAANDHSAKLNST